MKGFGVWLRERPMVVLVFVVAIALGPVFARFVFPDVEPWRHVVGGVIAGFYFAMCAIPQKLVE